MTRKRGNYRQAITEYQKIIEHSNNKELIEEARFNTAEAYLKLVDLNQAKDRMGPRLTKFPMASHADEAYHKTATTYFIQGKISGILRALPAVYFQIS